MISPELVNRSFLRYYVKFLNADGKLDDVSKELRAFLDYVAGKWSEDSFVKKLEQAVKEAKKNREWRHEYMTLLMRDQENIEKGMEQGMQTGKIYGMITAYRALHMPDDEISEKLQEIYDLSKEEAERYLRDSK